MVWITSRHLSANAFMLCEWAWNAFKRNCSVAFYVNLLSTICPQRWPTSDQEIMPVCYVYIMRLQFARVNSYTIINLTVQCASCYQINNCMPSAAQTANCLRDSDLWLKRALTWKTNQQQRLARFGKLSNYIDNVACGTRHIKASALVNIESASALWFGSCCHCNAVIAVEMWRGAAARRNKHAHTRTCAQLWHGACVPQTHINYSAQHIHKNSYCGI